MIFASFVFYCIINCAILVLVKKLVKIFNVKTFWMFMLVLYSSVLIYDMKESLG